MKHIISTAVTTYLEECSLLQTTWILKYLSTATQLLEITHAFAAVIKLRFQADAIFTDFLECI